MCLIFENYWPFSLKIVLCLFPFFFWDSDYTRVGSLGSNSSPMFGYLLNKERAGLGLALRSELVETEVFLTFTFRADLDSRQPEW